MFLYFTCNTFTQTRKCDILSSRLCQNQFVSLQEKHSRLKNAEMIRSHQTDVMTGADSVVLSLQWHYLTYIIGPHHVYSQVDRCDWQVHCDWVGLLWELLPGASVTLNPTSCLFDPIFVWFSVNSKKDAAWYGFLKILTSCRQSIIHGEPCVIWNLFQKYFLCLYFHMYNKYFFFIHLTWVKYFLKLHCIA